ncbi:MAG TPA: hypothetical protein DCY48_04830 [Candidatus Magasanikbacteria bacterium]|nr:MAG: hypothetical protein A3I74_03310 [Candidatus Magasanikbacteria bacterium RIFCSPLOWO2_02_FULL_47_16]OGH80236.1 MAG: hypothetical protein A3C10_03590 [Candidatus Magasanikbacteria bacterium RIFCSPHIGHO2_02_FULL_48_18]OGH82134.1 MAG: hypothetical protein A3G08_02105 [Candidatus Magasanikbacteria bacterium RIFCSPLOWO2_12_FULL_47_9b]HAZ29064.1 hypothetical protein [Candidatus Magasanikbacteria bacterium]
MTANEAEQFLFSLFNLPRKEYMASPKKSAIYLQRLQFFLDILENPEKRIPHYIHVTGTSGKGSVVNFIHSIFFAAGKRVGSTTSPHPTILRERWRVGKTMMSESDFVNIVARIKMALDTYIRTSPYDIISYFELTTAIALLYFAQKKVSYAVVEVGCGGRFDGTNIIPHKDIAIITNIGTDHADIIGPTKKDIAREKAGIISKKCTVFSSIKESWLEEIVKKEVTKKNATYRHVNIPSKAITMNTTGTSFPFGGERYHLSVIGKHQATNAALAITAALELGIQKKAIHRGLAQTNHSCALERFNTKSGLVLLDSAHNEQKMKTTVDALREWYPDHPIALLVGFSENKPVRKMVRQLRELNLDSVACTRNSVNPFRKVAPPQDIAALFCGAVPAKKITSHLDPRDALTALNTFKEKKTILLITGSLFLAGQLRPIIKNI